MASWYEGANHKPLKNPQGGSLGADHVQLERITQGGAGAGAMEAFNYALELVKAKPTEAIGYPLIVMALSMAFQTVLQFLGYMIMFFGMAASAIAGQIHETLAVAIGGLLAVCFGGLFIGLMVVMQAAIMGGIHIAWLRLVRGQALKVEHMLEVKRFIKPLSAGMLLYLLGVMTGYMLLFIPGLIFFLGCHFHSMVVLDKNLSGYESLRASWALMRGHKLSFFGLLLLLGVVNMVGLLTCGIGFVITMPLSQGAMVAYYDALVEPGNAYLGENESVDNIFA